MYVDVVGSGKIGMGGLVVTGGVVVIGICGYVRVVVGWVVLG
jgi:hypothetical protein